MSYKEVGFFTGYYADAAKSTSKRTAVHIVDNHRKCLCKAPVKGEFMVCAEFVFKPYVTCKNCLKIYEKGTVKKEKKDNHKMHILGKEGISLCSLVRKPAFYYKDIAEYLRIVRTYENMGVKTCEKCRKELIKQIESDAINLKPIVLESLYEARNV